MPSTTTRRRSSSSARKRPLPTLPPEREAKLRAYLEQHQPTTSTALAKHVGMVGHTGYFAQMLSRIATFKRHEGWRLKGATVKTAAAGPNGNGKNGHPTPVIVPDVPSLAAYKSPVAASVEILKKAQTPLRVRDIMANLKAYDFKGKTNETSLGVTMRQAETQRKYKQTYGVVGVRQKGSRNVAWTVRA